MKLFASIVWIIILTVIVQSETIIKSNSSKIDLFLDKYEYEVTNTNYRVSPYYPGGG